jgi:hypothetical protein
MMEIYENFVLHIQHLKSILFTNKNFKALK